MSSGELPDGHPLKEGTPQPSVAAAADVNDHALVPGLLATLTLEVRSGFDKLTDQVIPSVERLTALTADHAARLSNLERDHHNHKHVTDTRLAALEAKRKRKRKVKK